jgi:hypothetical protein
MRLHSAAAYVAVRAVSASGRELGASAPVRVTGAPAISALGHP